MGWDWRGGQREQLLLWHGGTWRGRVPIFGFPRFHHLFRIFFRSASHPQATSKIGENPKFQGSFLHHDISKYHFSSSARELELAQPMPHPGHGGGPLTTNLAESWGVKPESDCDTLWHPQKRKELKDLAYRNIQGIFTVLIPQIRYKTYRVQTYMSEIHLLCESCNATYHVLVPLCASGLQDFIHIVTGVEAARLTVLGIRQMSRLDVLKRKQQKRAPFFGAGYGPVWVHFFFFLGEMFPDLIYRYSCVVRWCYFDVVSRCSISFDALCDFSVFLPNHFAWQVLITYDMIHDSKPVYIEVRFVYHSHPEVCVQPTWYIWYTPSTYCRNDMAKHQSISGEDGDQQLCSRDCHFSGLGVSSNLNMQ